MELTTNAVAHAPLHDADLNWHVLHITLRLYHLQHVLKPDHVDLCFQQICQNHTVKGKGTAVGVTELF